MRETINDENHDTTLANRAVETQTEIKIDEDNHKLTMEKLNIDRENIALSLKKWDATFTLTKQSA